MLRSAPAAFSVVLLTAFALVGCGDSSAETAGGPKGKGRGGAGGDERSVPVAVRVTQPAELQVTLRGTANLQAREQVDVLPKQGGVIERILVEEGARVGPGQALAVLDAEEWRLQAEQQAARARAAQDAAERAVALHQQGLLADQEMERLRSEADVARAEAELARLRVSNAVIRSPMGGTVTHRWVERGQLVTPATRAFSLADLDRLEARVGVPEREAYRVRVGQPARLLVEGTSEVAQGRVARIRPVVDPESGTVEVTVEVDPALSTGVRPGQFVTVEIVTETLQDRITLPRTAVLVDAARPRVFVVEGGVAAEREVSLGTSEGNEVEIQTGIAPGDTVVVVGQDALRPGTAVRLVEVDGQRLPVAATPAPARAAGGAEKGTGRARGKERPAS